MTVALSGFGNDFLTARERIEVRATVVNVDALGTLQIIHNPICDRRRHDFINHFEPP